ncbi:nucleotidyltransferase family protein [Sphingomonas sp. SUN019]|uniref:nucleotidyltransferase family protein n=1 Tax=Sphingomonas sp. SUN019 TaxID=2937788 RepID=UPI002164C20F|nr:nucleotidyltransferase family protein [Sphingomonas sp. SUN019]UVO51954.1 nucleotidyltransferase family protein [Sphingomonas sp. SUN019]
MIEVETCVLILLAAGRSERFGDGNKLEEEFLGKPVGLHVVTALEEMPFMERVAVIDGCSLDFAGRDFTVLRNEDAASGMSGSVRIGVAYARERGAAAVVIALADMPRVTATHIYRLLDAAESSDAVVVSSDGVQPMPPGVFGRDRFDFLMALKGDKGARDLVKAGRHVVTTPAELIDIDTPEDLERLRRLIRAPKQTATRPVV